MKLFNNYLHISRVIATLTYEPEWIRADSGSEEQVQIMFNVAERKKKNQSGSSVIL